MDSTPIAGSQMYHFQLEIRGGLQIHPIIHHIINLQPHIGRLRHFGEAVGLDICFSTS